MNGERLKGEGDEWVVAKYELHLLLQLFAERKAVEDVLCMGE